MPTARALRADPRTHPMRVLLADRDDDTRGVCAEHLARAAYTIEEAIDGRQALAIALSRPPDAIVTAAGLEGFDGYQLCGLLRRDPVTAQITIIFVTDAELDGDLRRAQEAGADVVLKRPFPLTTLVAELQRTLMLSAESRRRARAPMLDCARGPASPLRHTAGESLAARDRGSPATAARRSTMTPPLGPPQLICPICNQPLRPLFRSHLGGVSVRQAEQWDYFECRDGCGTFQYRQRTRSIRHVS